MQTQIEKLVRKNIRELKPYSSARHEFKGAAEINLDANESPYGIFNRYPDPLQLQLKEKISELKGVAVSNIFLGNGSDEAIDLLIRIFCEPGKNNIIICPPTYGMYEVCAAVNNVSVKVVPLTDLFQLDLRAIRKNIDSATSIIFICSPNNPTGNCIERIDIKSLLSEFEGIVVLDEAYIDFANETSLLTELSNYPNLVILQTFSKAWGLAGLRLGMAFANSNIINYMNKVKYPYNINAATQSLALKAISDPSTVKDWIDTTIEQREWLRAALGEVHFVEQIYPSYANFILIKVKEPTAVYEWLAAKGIIVRHRLSYLRITVGSPKENQALVQALKEFS